MPRDTSAVTYTRSELEALSRKRLQQVAKHNSIKANLSTKEIINRILGDASAPEDNGATASTSSSVRGMQVAAANQTGCISGTHPPLPPRVPSPRIESVTPKEDDSEGASVPGSRSPSPAAVHALPEPTSLPPPCFVPAGPSSLLRPPSPSTSRPVPVSSNQKSIQNSPTPTPVPQLPPSSQSAPTPTPSRRPSLQSPAIPTSQRQPDAPSTPVRAPIVFGPSIWLRDLPRCETPSSPPAPAPIPSRGPSVQSPETPTPQHQPPAPSTPVRTPIVFGRPRRFPVPPRRGTPRTPLFLPGTSSDPPSPPPQENSQNLEARDNSDDDDDDERTLVAQSELVVSVGGSSQQSGWANASVSFDERASLADRASSSPAGSLSEMGYPGSGYNHSRSSSPYFEQPPYEDVILEEPEFRQLYDAAIGSDFGRLENNQEVDHHQENGTTQLPMTNSPPVYPGFPRDSSPHHHAEPSSPAGQPRPESGFSHQGQDQFPHPEPFTPTLEPGSTIHLPYHDRFPHPDSAADLGSPIHNSNYHPSPHEETPPLSQEVFYDFIPRPAFHFNHHDGPDTTGEYHGSLVSQQPAPLPRYGQQGPSHYHNAERHSKNTPWHVTETDVRGTRRELTELIQEVAQNEQRVENLLVLLGEVQGRIESGSAALARMAYRRQVIENGILPNMKQKRSLWDGTNLLEPGARDAWMRYVEDHWEAWRGDRAYARREVRERARREEAKVEAEKQLDELRERLVEVDMEELYGLQDEGAASPLPEEDDDDMYYDD